MPRRSAHHIVMLLENNPYPQDGRVRREASALVAAGFTVTVVAPKSHGQPSRETVSGVSVRRYNQPFAGDGLAGYVAEYTWALFRSMATCVPLYVTKRFAAIHAHNPPDMFVLVAALFRPFGVKFVFDHHDLAPEMYDARFPDGGRSSVRAGLGWFERASFKLADLVVSTNESYAEIAHTRGKVPTANIAVVRNGPDPNRVRLTTPDPVLVAKADYLIGYVGEMAPHDGVDHMIRALAILAHEVGREDFHAVLIGGGSEVPALKGLARELDIEQAVTFTGPIGDADVLMSYLSATAVCVTPDGFNEYTDKSTTIKTAEYMALGKPVVAFDLTENRRTAGDAALYAAKDDDVDLAHQIDKLLSSKELRDELGAIGAERVVTSLAWPHQATHLVDAYRRLLPETGAS